MITKDPASRGNEEYADVVVVFVNIEHTKQHPIVYHYLWTIHVGKERRITYTYHHPLSPVQTKDMEDSLARRSAQRATAAMSPRAEVKLVTGAQLSEAGS